MTSRKTRSILAWTFSYGQLPIMMFSLFGGVFADRNGSPEVAPRLAVHTDDMRVSLNIFVCIPCRKGMANSRTVICRRAWAVLRWPCVLLALADVGRARGSVERNRDELHVQFNLARIIGPTLGGLTYTTLGATWCFTLNGFSYLAVIASLFLIQVKFVPAKTTDSVLSSMKEGIRFIRQRDGMSALVVLAFCTTLFGFSLNGFIPVFVRDVFHKGPETYTLLLVCSGAGSICGALAVATSERLKGQGRLTLLILAMLGSDYSRILRIEMASSILHSDVFRRGGIMASASFMLSLAQLISTDAMRGRVMSVYNLAFRAGIPLGALGLGKLIPVFGVSKSLAGAGIALTSLSLYFLASRKDETFRSSRSVRF